MTQPWTPDDDAPPPIWATRDQLREWVDNHAQVQGGISCPTCDCRVADDAYSLRRTWVEVMSNMGKHALHSGQEWVELKKFNTIGGVQQTNASFLALEPWGLLERQARRADGYRSNGFYRLTEQRGWPFLQGLISVPRRIIKRRDRVRAEDPTDRVYVHDVLGGPFNFDSFMKGEG